jgi:hypothetical protein
VANLFRVFDDITGGKVGRNLKNHLNKKLGIKIKFSLDFYPQFFCARLQAAQGLVLCHKNKSFI